MNDCYEVGEKFELFKCIYEVRENDTCQGCTNYIEDENECVDILPGFRTMQF